MGYIQLANTSDKVVVFGGVKVPSKTSILVSKQVLDKKDLEGNQSLIILPLKDDEAEKLEAEKLEAEKLEAEKEEPKKQGKRNTKK